MKLKVLVIIPTYNEVENISDIINAVLEQGDQFEILIVDDNSPDGTVGVVSEKIQKYPSRVHLLQRPGKQGLGTAYIEGFKYGIKNDYDYLYEMDADFSHDPKDLPRLLNACLQNGADLAIGSRYVEGGGLQDWPWIRRVLSKGASRYVKLITSMPVQDSTAGFKCYKSEVLKTINLGKIKCKGYAFQIEMKYATFLNGFKIVEVPIIFKDREKGTSKMSGRIIFEALRGVITMKINSLKGYYKFV
ncbi:MAG TPA: polyprenol monophosphomannose synthase [Saprospiraceae bacterium]|nr:polyprenol monophosphomannose synthase [Saprospiraceae bacterium]